MNLSIKLVCKKHKRFLYLAFPLFIAQSCATYGPQIGKNAPEIKKSIKSDVDFKLFLVGDAGNSDEPQSQHTLNLLKTKLDSADQNSMLVFLGDNIYPHGLPKEDDPTYNLAKEKLENQLNITKNYKGKTLVIPGNHDWYNGLDGLKAQEKFVKKYFDSKKAFLPKNSCPIDDISLNKNTKLIVIDSEWALIDWDKFPGINKDCTIKTEEDLYKEFKDLIIKNQDKQVIVALHHPILSSGTHAGYTSAKSHLFPLKGKIPAPGIATLINLLRSSSGVSMEDLNNKHYANFANRIKSIVQEKDNVIFISGHDHNLQYHQYGNIRQIISGAGSKTDPSTIAENTDFSYGGSGFAVLNLRKDGSSDVEYFSTKNNDFKRLAHLEVQPRTPDFINNYPTDLPKYFSSTVYPVEETKKGKVYTWLFGEHYRKYYGIPINAPVADLQTLNGGFTPTREGGGNQSNSLRLVAKDGQEYVMRGVKKSATRFLNSVAFKNKMFAYDFYDTFPQKFLLDFYTANHPFTPFITGDMQEKLGIFSSNPKLFYVPKQQALDKYNLKYGDEMYMIEERFSSDPITLKMLDNATDIVSTEDVLKNLETSDKFSVDKESYLRVRLFDMLIGDWDRHSDQWKWAAYTNGDKTVYKAVPKDRDQAFSKYDGKAFFFIMNIPAIRHMKTFKGDLKNVKWFNMEPYPMDLVFAKDASKEDWVKQAIYIQENLNEKDINNAFSKLPKEVQDETITEIKKNIVSRKSNLQKYAENYFNVLQTKVPLAGTTNKDRFIITKNEKSVEVQQFWIDKDNAEYLVFSKNYNDNLTKELWIYGLEDDDIYEVKGNGKSKINIRLIGGYNHDSYNVENGRNVKIYDFKSQKNTYNTDSKTSKHIKDDYLINTYDYKHPKYNFFAGYPNANFNPDDGIILGLVGNYTVNNFIRAPFTQKHIFKANVYTATGGANFEYNGKFKKAFAGWDVDLIAKYTTPHFSQNFFGYSNESLYTKEDKDDRMYNRTRIRQFNFYPSISKTSWLSFTNKFQLDYENIKVERNQDRFVEVSPDVNPIVFDNQSFAGASYTFSFENYDNPAFPTLGMSLLASAAWKTNVEDLKRNFVTLNGTLSITHRIDKKGDFVFANSTNAMWINNDNFEFYQAASLGGNTGLRAYRNQRFSGNSYLVNSSEVRWDFGRIRNTIVPANLGILVGYDIGRVWNKNEISNKWHQSVGAGLWINVLETLSARLNVFTGNDGMRISGGIGMNF